ncbi:6PF2K-domain-containing protein [Meira miltonrushii]|uniref:Nuclear movement protein nudC n=1 Tax=Meira miltonrushii TaxID=1280837 RepID=A0A316V5Y5_9BASI|nr:6PF2K-domain-containing protein [Meira miltonrushii]PWN32882.1 6PF2K-domain-containing protein [Meira miltonrushii]
MAAPLYTTESGQLFHAGKILIATVGLPARGKTHMSHALERYLRWLGVKCGVYSLGDYRRKILGGADKVPPDYFKPGPKSPETEALRKHVLDEFDKQVVDYFTVQGGQVVIYDANNGLLARRAAIREKYGGMGIHVMFIESICTDENIVNENIRRVKISSPDYRSWNSEKAIADFKQRIKNHEAHYEPIEQPSFPYIKVVNVGQKIHVNNIQGYLQSRVVFFLMNIHNRQRTIYLARAGEALIEHLYKADADLSSLGWEYAEELVNCVDKVRSERADESIERAKAGIPTTDQSEPGQGPGEEGRPLDVWVSARRRSSHTALPFADRGYRVIERSQLSELNPGVIDGLSEDEIKVRFPDEWDKKRREPYSHRFPRAESYHDLSVRLEPIIFELERATDDVLIIGQSSVLRCLIAYLQGRKPNEIPNIQVHEGELIEISPQAYGVKTDIHKFWDPEQKRKSRDEAYFRGRMVATAHSDAVDENGHADETLPDLHKLPLHALEGQSNFPPKGITTQQFTDLGRRDSHASASSSSSTEGGDQYVTKQNPGEDATTKMTDATEITPSASSIKRFHEISLEQYDKLSKPEQEAYDQGKAIFEREEQDSLPYRWAQTLESVTLTMPLPDKIRARDLDVVLKRSTFKVAIKKGAILLDDELFNLIKEDDSTWSVSDGILDVHLEKAQKDQWWPHVLKGAPKIDTTKIVPENSKLSDLDAETRAMVEKMMFDNRQKQMGLPTSDQQKQQEVLEKFKSAHPEMDFSNVKTTF